MRSPKDKLVCGSLLGDVVEGLTGQDLRIERYNVKKSRNHTGEEICSHRIRAYSGRYLICTARVIWLGKSKAYALLVRERMRNFLKRNRVKPTVVSIDESKGVLNRLFIFSTHDGNLEIRERIYFKKLVRIKIKTKN